MKTKHNRFFRRGSAVVEAAVVAPLMLTSMLGMFQFGYAYMVKQTVTLASREGARAASLPGGTLTDATNAVSSSMASAKLTGYTMTSNVSTLQPTDTSVWVKVSIPLSQAAFTGHLLGGSTFNIAATTTMRREGVDASGGGGQGVTPP